MGGGWGRWVGLCVWGSYEEEKNNQQVTRTQDTPIEKTPPTPAHTRARQDPQTNTSHKHLTTLNGGATTMRATSHARVGGRAEVSMRGRVEV